jgi:site-specific recombinase XerC
MKSKILTGECFLSSKVCDSQLKDFLSFLQVERGLAQNTVDSYRYDLEQYAFFLKDKGLSFLEATQSIIFNFLNYQREQNLSARTRSRKLAAIRSLYRFLLQEGKINNDPTENITSPRLEKNLPRVLSVKDVDLLLCQPNSGTVLGLRDKAIIQQQCRRMALPPQRSSCLSICKDNPLNHGTPSQLSWWLVVGGWWSPVHHRES